MTERFDIPEATRLVGEAATLGRTARRELLASAVLSRHPDPILLALYERREPDGTVCWWFEPLSTTIVASRIAELHQEIRALEEARARQYTLVAALEARLAALEGGAR